MRNDQVRLVYNKTIREFLATPEGKEAQRAANAKSLWWGLGNVDKEWRAWIEQRPDLLKKYEKICERDTRFSNSKCEYWLEKFFLDARQQGKKPTGKQYETYREAHPQAPSYGTLRGHLGPIPKACQNLAAKLDL